MTIKAGLIAAMVLGLAAGQAQAQEAPKLKVMGMPLATGNIQKNREQPFFEKLKETTGIEADYKVLDQTGIKEFEQLRIASPACSTLSACAWARFRAMSRPFSASTLSG